MKPLQLPYGLPMPGGPVDRPNAIPDMPGFGSPIDPDAPKTAGGRPLPQFTFRPQVLVQDSGVTMAEPPIAVRSGEIKDTSADGLTLTCQEDNINGVYVGEDAVYTLKNTDICFTGDGVNDFAGAGAGVQVVDNATLIIENSRIETTGVIRPCSVAGGYSSLIVRNSQLIGNGGTLPPGAPKIPGPGMKEPPVGLGIGGNCRTHLSTGDSHSYFYDSTIYADGWAALSTDACYGDMYLEANRCIITVKNSGYATYSDHGGNVVLNDCKVSAELGAIVAGKCRETLNLCTTECSRNLALIHSVFGNTHEISELTVNGGTARSHEELVRIKSQNAYLDFRGVEVSSDNGVILHSYLNDDPCATKVSDGEEVYGIKAVFSDMEIHGDFLHEDPQRTMALHFKHTKVQGQIENAIVCLDQSSRWIATADSHVFLTGYGPMGTLDALPGVMIYADSDKRSAGTYPLPSGGQLVVSG